MTAPIWLSSAKTLEWLEIPGTVYPTKRAAESYSGMAVTPQGKIIIAASGGHTDGDSNEVYGIDLSKDFPKWEMLCTPSPVVTYEQPYAPDGKPSARHTYDTPQYLPSINRVVLAGAYSVAKSGNTSFPTMDGFNLSTNVWDAAGAYAYAAPVSTPYPGPKDGYYPPNGSADYRGGMLSGCMVDGDGNLWATDGVSKYITATNTWSVAAVSKAGEYGVPRSPWAFDSIRNESFGVCYGDGHGYSTNLGVVAARRAGGVVSKITFNDSPAMAQFAKDCPSYAAMTYDTPNVQYLFYYGFGECAGRVFSIKANNSDKWDISILPTKGAIPSTAQSGVNNRFQFVPSLGGVVCLPCDGRGVFFLRTSTPSDAASPEPEQPAPSTPPINPVTTSPLGAITSFGVSAGSAGVVPFSMGFAFARGHVPAGSNVTSSDADLQVVKLNDWPDGSMKMAHIAGRVAAQANVDSTINLRLGNSAPAPMVTVSGLGAVRMEISCGAYGTVSWSSADWLIPFETYITGPKMSCFIYRKPVGTDKHLVAWLEVNVFSTGQIEVLPSLENGYCRVSGPTNKPANYTFSINGVQRVSVPIDLKHHQRTPIISGTALSYWVGDDPQVMVKHDKEYLQASEMVPRYSGKVAINSGESARLVKSFTPLQIGNITYDDDNMASSGYQRTIGLLPTHDVLYLTSDNPEAYAAVVRNGYSAGRYSLHYRDEDTNKPILFSKFPTFSLRDSQGFKDNGGSTNNDVGPAATGGNGASWDTAHSFLPAYMAFILTGRKYFLEEVQFAANFDYIGMGDNQYLRVGDKGLMRPCIGAWQTRSFAWAWRTRAAALAITPNSDSLIQAEYVRTFKNNIDNLYDTYATGKNNPWGIVSPGEAYDSNLTTVAVWQQNFATGAIGWSMCMGLPIGAEYEAKLHEFFKWKAKSTVLTLGTPDKFWYVNPAPYALAISPPVHTLVDYEGGTGPWLSTEAEIYSETYKSFPPESISKTDGIISCDYDIGSWATSMLGNLHPAIAYAIRHNVPGATEGYARLKSAKNYSEFHDGFNLKPVWSVVPNLKTDTPPPKDIKVTYKVSIGFTKSSQTLPAGTEAVATNFLVEILKSDGASVIASSMTSYDFTGIPAGSYIARASGIDSKGRVMGTPAMQAFVILEDVLPVLVDVLLPSGISINYSRE